MPLIKCHFIKLIFKIYNTEYIHATECSVKKLYVFVYKLYIYIYIVFPKIIYIHRGKRFAWRKYRLQCRSILFIYIYIYILLR